MLRKGKKRVSITVDAELLDRVTSALDDLGYPFGALSHYLNDCLAKLDDYFHPGDHDINPILELEISRVGLKAACEKMGMTVIQWSPDDEKPRRRS